MNIQKYELVGGPFCGKTVVPSESEEEFGVYEVEDTKNLTYYGYELVRGGHLVTQKNVGLYIGEASPEEEGGFS